MSEIRNNDVIARLEEALETRSKFRSSDIRAVVDELKELNALRASLGDYRAEADRLVGIAEGPVMSGIRLTKKDMEAVTKEVHRAVDGDHRRALIVASLLESDIHISGHNAAKVVVIGIIASRVLEVHTKEAVSRLVGTHGADAIKDLLKGMPT